MATTEILDFLSPAHREFNSQQDKYYLKIATQKIAVSPRWWSQNMELLSTQQFDWCRCKYTELDGFLANNPSLGNEIGVYLFVVKPDIQIAELPGYVFYVGIAGEHDSGRPLRARLRQYIQISGIKKRNKVQTALELYHDATHVYFSSLNITSEQLSQIEMALHAFFMPWANERDYPADIKLAIRAF